MCYLIEYQIDSTTFYLGYDLEDFKLGWVLNPHQALRFYSQAEPLQAIKSNIYLEGATLAEHIFYYEG